MYLRIGNTKPTSSGVTLPQRNKKKEKRGEFYLFVKLTDWLHCNANMYLICKTDFGTDSIKFIISPHLQPSILLLQLPNPTTIGGVGLKRFDH
jgi:hypothetical protein